ncbi:MAG: MarR family transcriptional regulator [Proteobacteria bacterium]|nr:MarR family transcriptional regulator [Pseudomonadota bacterium]
MLGHLQKIDPEFPLQYAICLCEIAINEGLSLTCLSERTGMPISTVSRIVGALSEKRQCGHAYGLVRVTLSPTEKRRKQLYLSAHGKSLIGNIEETIALMGT